MISSSLKAVLAPLLIAQGKRVRRVTPRLPEPEGARSGRAGSGSKSLRLLIVGDSAAAGVGADSQDQAFLGCLLGHLNPHVQTTYRLIARTGARVEHTLEHLRALQSEPFDVVVISHGINSITANVAPDLWLARYRELVGELQTRFGAALVVVSGLPPIGQFPAIPAPLRWYVGDQARRYDLLLRAWADATEGIVYVPFAMLPGDSAHGVPMRDLMASDGFHPGPIIYDLWADRVAQLICAHLDEST